MRKVRIASWSQVLPTRTQLLHASENDLQRIKELPKPLIPRGAGRSYGDAAYVSDGITLSCRDLRRLDAVDSQSGAIHCQSGVQIDDLFSLLDSTEWEFPIGGGTRWTTIGGCIGSDVHGKNDVSQGSFGNHVESLRIVLANGDRVECSPTRHPDLFAATIGGMGLTGFIESARLRLRRAPSRTVESRAEVISSPGEMAERFRTRAADFSVAWLDLLSPRFRGIYYWADYAEGRPRRTLPPLEIPLPRFKLFTRPFVRAMNALRFALNADTRSLVRVQDFHHPVDAVKHWNRFYGRRGFHEYQFLVSEEHHVSAMEEFLAACRRFSIVPFFAVVKKFGSMKRQGLLSFPRPGITIMADFENTSRNGPFFSYFTDFVKELGGRIYLAKDSYLTDRQFESMYEHTDAWREIVQRYDPENRLQSDLSRRLRLKPW